MSEFRKIVENLIDEANSKASIKNKIYKAVTPFTNHVYHDEYWRGYRDILKAIEDLGFEVISGPSNNDGYHSGGYTGDGKEKQWDLIIQKDNETILNGHITAFAAGTVEYPFDSYDLTVTLW